MREEKDAALLKAVARNDNEALNVLYKRWKDKLFYYILYRVSREEEAREILQDVFLSLWKNAGQFKGDSSPYTWIFSITRNKIADYFRRLSKLRKIDEAWKEEMETSNFERENQDEKIDLLDALNRLDPSTREAIVLIFYQGLNYKETGEVLGLPEGTVKSKVHYGRQKLGKILKKGGGY